MPTRHQRSDYRAFFLVGPTAVGKTAVAQWIAEQQGFDILSADSMQVYRGMDIGTAKPAAEERRRVRYWGMDLVSPRERFSVGDYRAAALQAIGIVAAAQRRLIVTGGTGLYIKSLTDGLTSQPPRHDEIRARAEQLLKDQGIAALQEWLNRLDPARYRSLPDSRNPRRLIRAIELSETGQKTMAPAWKPAASPRIPGLMLALKTLYALIEERVRRMYAGGLMEEVQRLLDEGLAEAPTASQAIGYSEVMAYLNGQCSRQEAMARTIVRTRHLAKRQMTWFRHQAHVDWLTIDETMPMAERAQMVLDYWQANGTTPVVAARYAI